MLERLSETCPSLPCHERSTHKRNTIGTIRNACFTQGNFEKWKEIIGDGAQGRFKVTQQKEKKQKHHQITQTYYVVRIYIYIYIPFLSSSEVGVSQCAPRAATSRRICEASKCYFSKGDSPSLCSIFYICMHLFQQKKWVTSNHLISIEKKIYIYISNKIRCWNKM